MKKLFALLMATLLVLSLFTGCGVGDPGTQGSQDSSSSSGSAEKDTVVYGTPTAPAGTFNPALAYMGGDNDIIQLSYASLLETHPDGSVYPYLAEDYAVSDDQLSITFTLRSDALWQDGEAVTVDDVIFTFEAIAKSADDFGKISYVKGAQEFRDGTADSISGITTPDENSVKLELTETYAPILKQLGTYGILPEHIWGEIPQENWETQTELLNYPIGCGPYQVTKYESGQYVQLEAFEDFFGGAPKIKNFIYKVVNQDAISAELVNGNVDVVNVKELRTSEIEELEEAGLTKYSVPDEMYQYISFNLRLPIFQDKNLRQAMVYAIDRKLMLETIVEGRGVLLDSPFLPSGWANPAEGELNDYAYDPDKAVELLEASGWTDTDGDGIRENAAGEKLQFTLRCSNDSKTRENAVLYVKECLAKVGIDIEVSIEEDAVVAEDCIYNHNFEMYALNCYFGDDLDPYGWWHSDSASDEPGVGSFNFGSYKNDIVDENIEKGLTTMDQSERQAYYLEVAKQINEDVPMIFLYVQDREIMCNPDLEGFEPYTFNIFYNVHNWQFA